MKGTSGQSDMNSALSERTIQLGPGLASIPERLLHYHSQGEVLFIAGAGVSVPAGLPSFKDLVIKVYAKIDSVVHTVMTTDKELTESNLRSVAPYDFTKAQEAEVRRFIRADYDVVLGMLDRRMDGQSNGKSSVRQVVANVLDTKNIKPAPIHRALMRLADRGGVVSIVTTNFDLLLEQAAKNIRPAIETYALGGIPRPGRGNRFAGVFHIHGALDSNPLRTSDLVLTDQDFGEYYLRRRVVPDFIYDAARLFHLVLIGYRANDPPMRYLLNSVAADGTRFKDIKERFAFVGTDLHDPIEMEDLKGRGITPISYEATPDDHSTLLRTLERWAALSAINGKRNRVDAEVRRIVRAQRSVAEDRDRDLFDHLIRRSDSNQRVRLSALASEEKADLGWLEAIAAILMETEQENR